MHGDLSLRFYINIIAIILWYCVYTGRRAGAKCCKIQEYYTTMEVSTFIFFAIVLLRDSFSKCFIFSRDTFQVSILTAHRERKIIIMSSHCFPS
jgi:hypothetical protein